MMRFCYAGGVANISDGMCVAILEYTTALAGAGQCGVAQFPSVDDRGVTHEVKVLLGAGSQLWFVEVPTGEVEVDDRAAVAELHAKTTTVIGRHTHQFVETADSDWDSPDFTLDYG